MRSPFLFIAVALVLCGSAWLTLRADPHIDVSISTTRNDVPVSVSDGVATFSTATDAPGGLSVLNDPGQPALPVRLVNVLLPPGRRVEDVVATAHDRVVLATDVVAARAPLPQASPDAGAPSAAPLQSMITTAGTDTHPSQLVTYMDRARGMDARSQALPSSGSHGGKRRSLPGYRAQRGDRRQ
jgi:hypothetical protein